MGALDRYRYITVEDAARRLCMNRQEARGYLLRLGLVRMLNGRRRVLLADLLDLDDTKAPTSPAPPNTPTTLPSDDDLEM